MTDVDAVVARLRERSSAWAALAVREKIALLQSCRRATAALGPRWIDAAAKAKGVVGTPAESEEAFSGPWATVAGIDAYIATLVQIERRRRMPIANRVRRIPGDRVSVRAFPQTFFDRLLLPGLRAEVRMEPGIDRAAVATAAARRYREREPAPRVALVLGAGNVSSIAPLDVLSKLISGGAVVLLKPHPLQEHLTPILAQAFAPLIEAGFVQIVRGGAQTGRALCEHAGIDEIHVTGSQQTYASIREVAAPPTHVTGELGNVSPIVVVPGDWSPAEIRYQADYIVSAKLHNDGFNCVAPQVLVLPAGWDRAPALIAEIDAAMARAPDRPAYYPGARERLSGLLGGRDGVRRHGRDDAPFIARALVEIGDAQHRDELFEREAFGPLLAIVRLPGDTGAYLRDAVAFCNDRLAGNLAAGLVVAPADRRRNAAAVDTAIDELRYGCIGVNAWAGVAFALSTVPWGAHPESPPGKIGSGNGFVHNSWLLEGTEKTVLSGPFFPSRPFRAPWLLSNRNQANIARRLCEFQARPSLRGLAALARLQLRS